ncbi:RNA polymerase sigma factor [Planctomycetota bacterium]
MKNTEHLYEALRENGCLIMNHIAQEYQRQLTCYIVSIVRDRHLAEDLCQETFLKVYRNRFHFEKGGNFQNWLYTIARNIALDFLRSRRRERIAFIEDLEKEYCNDPFDNASRNEEAVVLRDAMRILTDRQHYALVEKENYDQTYREIGEQLNCTISRVRTLIHHAKLILREVVPQMGMLPKAG